MKLSKGHCLWFGNIVVMKRLHSGQFISITTSDRRLLERVVLRFVRGCHHKVGTNYLMSTLVLLMDDKSLVLILLYNKSYLQVSYSHTNGESAIEILIKPISAELWSHYIVW